MSSVGNYTILSGIGEKYLSSEVNKYLSLGYSLYGNPYVEGKIHYQAMIFNGSSNHLEHQSQNPFSSYPQQRY